MTRIPGLPLTGLEVLNDTSEPQVFHLEVEITVTTRAVDPATQVVVRVKCDKPADHLARFAPGAEKAVDWIVIHYL